MDEEPGQLALLPVERLLERDDVAAVLQGNHLVREALRLPSFDPQARERGVAEPVHRDDEPVGGHASAEQRESREDQVVALDGDRLRAHEVALPRIAQRAFAGHLDVRPVRRLHLDDDRQHVGARPGGEKEGEQRKAEPSKDAEPFHGFKNRHET